LGLIGFIGFALVWIGLYWFVLVLHRFLLGLISSYLFVLVLHRGLLVLIGIIGFA